MLFNHPVLTKCTGYQF